MNQPAAVAEPAPQEARFNAAQYRRIVESGALDVYGKAELHDGRIVVVNAQYVPHARLKTAIGYALRDSVRVMEPELEVLIEADVEVADGVVLQPDVQVSAVGDTREGVPVAQVRLLEYSTC